tara:strand:+ start:595 stop:1107 length:513 start_codon:yes stop_codon:yes gene_type:complete
MSDDKDIDDKVVRDFLKQSSGTEFNVPEDYFKGFQKNVHSKIYQDHTPWWKLPQIKIGVSVLTSVVLVFFVVKEFPENIDQAKYELNKEELLAYFSENIDEISEAEILEVMDDRDFIFPAQRMEQSDSTKTEKKKEENNEIPPTLDDFTDDEIYEYMLDEGYGSGDWDNL